MDHTHYQHPNNHYDPDIYDADPDSQDIPGFSLHPSHPQYASSSSAVAGNNIRGSRHRPSPKGEQRLWLYQCAVKSCSKGEMKIKGTSRPKGRDVPSCTYCEGKMHWKGTERDPAAAAAASSQTSGSTGGGSAGGGSMEEAGYVLGRSPSPSASRSPDADAVSHGYGYTHSYHGLPSTTHHHLLPSNLSGRYGTDIPRSRPGSSTTDRLSPSSAASAGIDPRAKRPWEL